MKVYLASDHGGFPLKSKVIPFLQRQGHTIQDMGPYSLDPNDDYPDYVVPLAQKVAKLRGALGIVLCRNGQGVCIATKKVKGIRSVTGFSVKEAKTTRKDDNANILCIPSDYLTLDQVKKIIAAWLATPFSGEARHKRRLRKVRKLER